MSKRISSQFVCIFFVFLLLAGCISANEELEVQIQTEVAVMVKATVNDISTSTPRPTHTPYPTLTHNNPPLKPDPTYTPYPTLTLNPTYTPYPALVPNPTYTPPPSLTPTQMPTSTVTLTAIPTNTPLPNNVQGRLLWNDYPMEDVEVRISGSSEQDGDRVFTTSTDGRGKYLFSVPSGEYTLSYRLKGNVRWSSGHRAPYFQREPYVDDPILIDGDKIIVLPDIHITKYDDLTIIFPCHCSETAQTLSSNPIFEWAAYPHAAFYKVWVYHRDPQEISGIITYSPIALTDTPFTSVSFSDFSDTIEPLSSEGTYYLWVIAYNANYKELADGRSLTFSVADE